MKPEDDQQLWDVLGRAAEPRVSPFFARNILREIRQDPALFQRAGSWLRLRVLVPAAGVAVAVIAAAVFMRSSSPSQNSPANGPEAVAINAPKQIPEPAAKTDAPASRPESVVANNAPKKELARAVKVDVPANQPEPAVAMSAPKKVPETVAKVDVPASRPEPRVMVDSQISEPQTLAKIDAQDYDVVANLDDLLVLYETSLWDDNSSL